MKLLGWKIYYSDTTYDSTQGSWDNAPSTDVQGVVVYFDDFDANRVPSRELILGNDRYSFDGKIFDRSDDYDGSQFKNKKIKGSIKEGSYTTQANIDRILSEMEADTGEGWLFNQPKRKVSKNKGDKFDQGHLPKQEKL